MRKVHRRRQILSLLLVSPVSRPALSVRETCTDIKHGKQLRIVLVFLQELLTDFDIVHSQERITLDGFALPAFLLQNDVLLRFRIYVVENVRQRLHFRMSDIGLEKHLIDDILRLDQIHIPQRKLGDAIPCQKFSQRRTDRTAADNMNASFDRFRVEDHFDFAQIHYVFPLLVFIEFVFVRITARIPVLYKLVLVLLIVIRQIGFIAVSICKFWSSTTGNSFQTFACRDYRRRFRFCFFRRSCRCGACLTNKCASCISTCVCAVSTGISVVWLFDKLFRFRKKAFHIGIANRNLDIIAAVNNILCHIDNTNVIIALLVPNHENVEDIIFKIVDHLPLLIHVHAAGIRRHIYMTVALKTQSIEGIIIELVLPVRVLFLVSVYRGSRDLLRIDQNLRDAEVCLVNTIYQTVPGNLRIKVIDQHAHFMVSFRGKVHLDGILSRLRQHLTD
nr:MAG TPA: hypothetical protein [Caudoviricetes sp.]